MFYIPKGKEIEKRRIQKGLSRHALSKIAGLGPYAVARLEMEMHFCHPLRAKALAEALECRTEDIFEIISSKPQSAMKLKNTDYRTEKSPGGKGGSNDSTTFCS